MSKLICTVNGVRGRSLEVYDNKCIIKTDATVGSILTRNSNDGEKTIFYVDCCGLQFKEAGNSIGFLQLETSTPQMNNLDSNYYSENSFTYDYGFENNRLMRDIYDYISVRMEGYKYHDETLLKAELPDALAEIYGMTHPLSPEEKEAELIREKEEKKKLEEEMRRKRKEREALYKEKALAGGRKDAERLAGFIAECDDFGRFKDIKDAWKRYGFTGDEYGEIEENLAKRAEVEKFYGVNANNIMVFLGEVKRKFNID